MTETPRTFHVDPLGPQTVADLLALIPNDGDSVLIQGYECTKIGYWDNEKGEWV